LVHRQAFGWLVSAESDATNPDLSAFIAKDGKAIITHGLADEIVSTDSSVDYCNALVQKFGQASADSLVRFYLMPRVSVVASNHQGRMG
jgi:hypothetical protein